MSQMPPWQAIPSAHLVQAGPSQPRQPPPQHPYQHHNHLSNPYLPSMPDIPPPMPIQPEPEPQQQQQQQRSSSPPVVAGLGQLVEPHQDLNDFLGNFWTRQMEFVERDNPDFRTYCLPLARIKKVMKSDEEVKMISAEAPILFSKACEIFISELTCRAWLIAESHKRRTLQKSDVAAAIALSDMFDFLIDILPRDDEGGEVDTGGGAAAESAGAAEDGTVIEGEGEGGDDEEQVEAGEAATG